VSRRVALFALRLAVAAGGLALVIRLAIPDAGEGLFARLRSAWVTEPSAAWGWIFVAASLFLTSYAVGALRFQLLLGSAGLVARFGALLRAYLIASFFNLVLPGLIMGDVYRLADARRDTGSGAGVLGIVALERLLGFAALGAMALLATPLLPGETPAWLRALVGLFGAATLLLPLAPFTASGRRLAAAVAGALARIAPRAGDAASGALDAIGRAGTQPGLLARAFVLSLANQWLPVLAVVALAAPLDTSVALYWYAVIIPFVTLASLLPISIGGTGVREALFVALFGAVGMRPEVALVLSLSTLFVALGWGLVGLGLFALGRRETEVGEVA
jgi:uncharacterized membrane protein YbhN (UPF0104 family)